jgi:hypothetical protein
VAASARRQLAASRIARAWRHYAGSLAFAARRQALLCLQAWARGLLARRRAAALRSHRALLGAVGAAVQAGALEGVRRAEAAAAAAGLHAEAAVLMAGFQGRVKAAVALLQQAAGSGTTAEFEAARAAAARFPHLDQPALECGAALAKRRAAAEAALQEAAAGERLGSCCAALRMPRSAAAPAPLGVPLDARPAAAGRPLAEVGQLAQQALQLGVPSARVDDSLQAAERRDSLALQRLLEAGAAQPCDLPAFEAACGAASRVGLLQQVAAAQQQLRRRREAAAWELGQLAGSCPDAAALLAQAADAEALGAAREALEARQQLQQRQRQAQAELLEAAASGSAAQVQALLQGAQQLQVPEAALQEAEQRLLARQHEAEQRLAAAAGGGCAGQGEVREAARAAKLLGCPEGALQAAAAALRQRQQAAASALQQELQHMLAALQASSSSNSSSSGAAEAVVGVAQEAAAALLDLASSSSSGSSSSTLTADHLLQQHRLQRHLGSQQYSALRAALQQVVERAGQCCRLGLAATSTRAAAAALQTQAKLLGSAGEPPGALLAMLSAPSAVSRLQVRKAASSPLG